MIETIPQFYIVTCGLSIEGEPTFEQWQNFGLTLRNRHRDYLWAFGDWLNAGEHLYGEKHSQVLEDTGYASEYISNVCWVCRTFEISRRRDDLFFAHHQTVAGLPANIADILLARAEQEHLSNRELRDLVKSLKPSDEPKSDPAPTVTTTKFGVFSIKQSGMGQALLTLSQEDSEVLEGLSIAHPGLTVTLTVEYMEESKPKEIEEIEQPRSE